MKSLCKAIIPLLVPVVFIASCTKDKTNNVQTSPLSVSESDELKDAGMQNSLVA